MDSFLVRVYRYNKHRPQDLIGTIQSTSQDHNQAFCSLEELWSILKSHIPENSTPPAIEKTRETPDSETK
jgi:hypothetical protein